MRRKAQPKQEPVVPPEILEQAKRALSADKIKKAEKCSVCGAETEPWFYGGAVLGLPPAQSECLARYRAADACSGIKRSHGTSDPRFQTALINIAGRGHILNR